MTGPVSGRQRRQPTTARFGVSGRGDLQAKDAHDQPARIMARAGREAYLRPDTIPTAVGICSGPTCGAEIRLATTVQGRRIPLDYDPDPAGTVVMTIVDGQPRARILTGVELPAQQQAWMPHHRSCPDHADCRRRQRATAPRCRACRGVLDPWLVEHGWHWHVLCAPLPDFRAYTQAARKKATK